MSYPEKLADLKPSELVSPPVITIDYELLKGCPIEVIDAVHALVDAYEGVGGGVVPASRPSPTAARWPGRSSTRP